MDYCTVRTSSGTAACPSRLFTESPEMFAHLYKGPTHCLRCIVRDNGVRGPFKALGLTAVRDCLSFAIFVSGYQYICDLLTPNYEVNEPSTGGYAQYTTKCHIGGYCNVAQMMSSFGERSRSRCNLPNQQSLSRQHDYT